MSIWSEIRSDFTDDEQITHIDAWVTEDDNEDGRTIAKISSNGTVTYLDERAKKDSHAQEVINNFIAEIVNL